MWMLAAWSVFLGLVGGIVTYYWYVQRKFSIWRKKGVPFRKPHWLTGNVGSVIKGEIPVAENLLDHHQEYRDERFFGMWNFYTLWIIVNDSEMLQKIMVKDFAVWPNRKGQMNEKPDAMSMSLLNLQGETWKTVRTKLSATFTSSKLKQAHLWLIECGKEFDKCLCKIVDAGGVTDAQDLSARFTTDVICHCIFGMEMCSMMDENSVFRVVGKKILVKSNLTRVLDVVYSLSPWLVKTFNLTTSDKNIEDFVMRIMKQNLDYRRKNNIDRRDLFSVLMKLTAEDSTIVVNDVASHLFMLIFFVAFHRAGIKFCWSNDSFHQEFTDELLTAQVFFFFVAGFFNSSTLISFCLHELAVNKDIQSRLREEVHRQKRLENGEISWDELKNMKYLDMVYKETLRKYPPVPLVTRKSVMPWRIPDTDIVLPTGTVCQIPIYGIHRDPKYYPNPEKFDPMRFTDEAKKQRPPFVFIPFGEGPRNCIGARFGDQLSKLAIITVVNNYEISLCEKSKSPLKLDPNLDLLFAKGGSWIRLTKR